jgi:hypothetical protein
MKEWEYLTLFILKIFFICVTFSMIIT